ncbi:MAG: FtsW/RodA/SpoVE family cell cycle protein [Fimbriimonadaceae bacterium]|nr:FtsW/RodA/SpoVE family cell cycle protein [Fimbriimonadaceae bacterium]
MKEALARKPYFWKRRVRGFDPMLFWLAVLASLIGLFFIFNAGYPRSISSGRGPITREFVMQGLFLIAGLAVWKWAAVQAQEKWLRWSKPLWWLCVAALAAVMIPGIGKELNGAHRWIGYKQFMIQPAEFAKVLVVLFLAGILATRKSWPSKFKRPKTTSLYLDSVAIPKFKRLLPALWVGLAFGLIAIEPDLGTAAVIGFVGYVMFAVGGITRKSLVFGTIVIAVLGVAVIRMESYRLDRIANHFHRWEQHNVDGIAYQTVQSELAMASGGVIGQGIGNGRAKHVLPAATTDFISATVAEELGLLGWLAVASVLAAITIRLLYLARYATTKFGSMVLLGIGSWIGVQAVTNLMMANGTLPPIGIPLPFVSYGGSSLVALWLALGICQAVLAPHMAVVQVQEEESFEAGRDGRGDGRTRLSGARSR